jgi:hypothetical protein
VLQKLLPKGIVILSEKTGRECSMAAATTPPFAEKPHNSQLQLPRRHGRRKACAAFSRRTGIARQAK